MMPAWKVMFIALFGLACFGLVMGTLLVPLTLTDAENRWVWFGGCLVGSIVMVTLFTMFLRHADRTFKR